MDWIEFNRSKLLVTEQTDPQTAAILWHTEDPQIAVLLSCMLFHEQQRQPECDNQYWAKECAISEDGYNLEEGLSIQPAAVIEAGNLFQPVKLTHSLFEGQETVSLNNLQKLAVLQGGHPWLLATGTKPSEGMQRRKVLIELIHSLMKKEKGSGNWPTNKSPGEGFLTFICRHHWTKIQREYGTIEKDSIRRICTPANCKKLGLMALPKS